MYLAKDSRMSSTMFRRTYPRFSEWQSARQQLDPQGLFISDLSRRLEL
ncbi:MAG: D-arabinono-1,4-lactone oxidase [Actinomycetales bacterium]